MAPEEIWKAFLPKKAQGHRRRLGRRGSFFHPWFLAVWPQTGVVGIVVFVAALPQRDIRVRREREKIQMK